MNANNSEFRMPVFGMSGDASDVETVTTETTPETAPVKAKGEQKESKILLVDPSLVRADHSKNGRKEAASETSVSGLVASFRKHGQLQAALVKRLSPKEKVDSGQEFELIFGFTRHAAALQIPGFKLKVAIVQGVNSEDSFLMNLEENRLRNSTNPIDDSYNIARLEDSFGWDSHKIADFYGWSQSKLSQVRRLKQLETPAQRKVASGLISIADAVKLLKMDEASVAEVLASVPDAPEPAPVVTEETPSGEPIESSVPPIDSGHPTAILPAKKKPGRKAQPKTQEEENRASLKRYNATQKAAKKSLKQTLHQKAKALSGKSGQRSVQDLKAVLKVREDAASKIILSFMAGESNAADLEQELNRIEECLTDAQFVQGPVAAE